MESTNHTRRPEAKSPARKWPLSASVLGFTLPTVFLSLSANGGGWPSTAEPAMWLRQPALYTMLVGCAIILLALLAWKLHQRALQESSSGKTEADDFWLRLNSVLSSAGTFNELLDSCMCLLAEKYHAVRGFVSLISQKEDRLRAVATVGGSPNGESLPAEDTLSKSIFRTCVSTGEVTIVAGPSGPPKPGSRTNTFDQWLAIPIVRNHKTLALIGLNCDSRTRGHDSSMSELDVIHSVISSGVRSFLAGAVGSIHRVAALAAEGLSGTLTGNDRIQDGLKSMALLISRFCPLDYISLSRLDPRTGDDIRWSATVNGADLVDWQYPILPRTGKDNREMEQITRPICDRDLGTNPPPTAIFETCRGMRSRMVFPIFDGDCRMGVLTLAHHEPDKYDETTCLQLEGMIRVFGQWLCHQDTEVISRRNARYLDVLNWLEEPARSTRQAMLPIMRQALAVTAVRLFRYDPARQTFSLAEASSCRPNGERELRGRHIPAAPLSLHRRALHDREFCAVDQGDPDRAMSVEESDLVRLGRFKTGVLVPVGDENHVQGVLSVIEMRHPARRRLAETDRVFLRCAAPRLSTLLTDDTIKQSRGRLPSALTAPLTTLGGSVDLIRQSDKDLDPDINRYLTNIERAAERIREFAVGEPQS